MPRFFIAASNIFGGTAYLSAQDVEHMRVLRIRRGEIFTVCDSNGTDYTCRINEDDPTGATVQIISSAPSAGEPSVRCTVYAAFSKGDKMDTVVQKCVELGAYDIVAFPSARCVSRPDGGALLKKLNRWQRIAEEAAKQSGRGIIPKVSSANSFAEAVNRASSADIPLFLYENEHQNGLRQAVSDGGARTIAVMSGPEGGFDDDEAAFAMSAGMRPVSLGTRILRCETAPVAALAAVMCLTGNLGG